jgi:hypothetical protein
VIANKLEVCVLLSEALHVILRAVLLSLYFAPRQAAIVAPEISASPRMRAFYDIMYAPKFLHPDMSSYVYIQCNADVSNCDNM